MTSRRRIGAVSLVTIACVLALFAWHTLHETHVTAPVHCTDAEDRADAAPVVTQIAADGSAARVVANDAAVRGRVADDTVRGAWGTAPGRFGRTRGEGNPEGPMAVAAGRDGRVLVVDQVNERVQVFAHGRFERAIPLPSATVQDVAVRADGRFATLDRLGSTGITLFDANGERAGHVALVGGAIREGGSATGLFADRDGYWVEREHRDVVRIANADGTPDPGATTLWGRPARDGHTLLRAAITDRANGVVTVSAAARENGAIDWACAVRMGAPIAYVAMLDGDAHGRAYVGAVLAVQAGDTLVVARVNSSGVQDARVTVGVVDGAVESFRTASIDDEGVVTAMVVSGDGVEVRRVAME